MNDKIDDSVVKQSPEGLPAVRPLPIEIAVPVLKALLATCSKDVSRPALCAISVEIDGGVAVATSTDGHILCQIRWKEPEAAEGRYAVPGAVARAHLAAGSIVPLTVDQSLVPNLPDYRQVIPEVYGSDYLKFGSFALSSILLAQIAEIGKALAKLAVFGDRKIVKHVAWRIQNPANDIGPVRFDSYTTLNGLDSALIIAMPTRI